jgi:putative tryptophan/tyrosine transport system substrate-binding protein
MTALGQKAAILRGLREYALPPGHTSTEDGYRSALSNCSLKPIRCRLSLGADDMRRREFIAGLAGTTVGWPLVARAQQPAMPVIGFLRSSPVADVPHLVKAFRDGLKGAGFIEGQNVTIEYRSGDENRDRLVEQARELIQRPVDVIVGNVVAAAAAKVATATVPIVFATGSDPVAEGLIASLNRPGGNLTGVSFLGGVVGAKRLELLRQLVPKATTIAMLVHPKLANTEAERRDVLAAARASGLQLVVADVSNLREIEEAFTSFVKRGAGALYVGTGAFLTSNRVRLAEFAARYALPSSFSQREAVEVGGLMSYGTSQTDAYRQVGVYTARILKGEKASDLPVAQATRFEFVINLKTAKTLGLEFHPQLLATADEVIE